MSTRKTLQELTIKDNFMFGAVMLNEENCRIFLVHRFVNNYTIHAGYFFESAGLKTQA